MRGHDLHEPVPAHVGDGDEKESEAPENVEALVTDPGEDGIGGRGSRKGGCGRHVPLAICSTHHAHVPPEPKLNKG